MRILVDGDACPVTALIGKIAARHGVGVVFFHSTCHHSSNSDGNVMEKIMVDNVSQAVDMAIINKAEKGDIVVTGDFGLASLVLGKKAYAVSFSGMIFNEGNIDRLLFERHVSGVIRRGGGRTKGPARRSEGDDRNFEKSLDLLISQNMKDI
ncbi:MAG TPA: YaiI/YqxD family protein [Clostridia bacterium]|nr:YaiI/YqxD family protein [Clostridia bacterium]